VRLGRGERGCEPLLWCEMQRGANRIGQSCRYEISIKWNVIGVCVCVCAWVLTSSVPLVLFLSGGCYGDCDCPLRKCYSCSVHELDLFLSSFLALSSLRLCCD
jgi:hypothetical protein